MRVKAKEWMQFTKDERLVLIKFAVEENSRKRIIGGLSAILDPRD